MNRDELRRFAQDEKDLHDPVKQAENPVVVTDFPDRCLHCNFTRHPCSTYDLADELLKLLDEDEKLRRINSELVRDYNAVLVKLSQTERLLDERATDEP